MQEYLDPQPEDRQRILKRKLMTILAAAVLWLCLKYVKPFIDGLPECERIPYIISGLYLAVAAPILFSLVLIRHALKSKATQQMPPPDTLIMRRTPVYRGAHAVRRANMIMFCSTVLIAATIAMTIIVTRAVAAIPGCNPAIPEAQRAALLRQPQSDPLPLSFSVAGRT